MATDCDDFAASARERLEGRHGLRFVECNEIGWTCSAFFANATTGVDLQWEVRILVLIGPLVDGRLPDPPTGVGPATRFGAHYLDALMELLGTDSPVGEYAMSEDDDVARRNVIRALDEVVEALERYAGTILDGDFSIFPRLDEAARARAEAYREGLLGD